MMCFYVSMYKKPHKPCPVVKVIIADEIFKFACAFKSMRTIPSQWPSMTLDTIGRVRIVGLLREQVQAIHYINHNLTAN